MTGWAQMPHALAARRAPPQPAVELQREHGVLLRQLARLQRELTPALQRLQQENLRLRAALVVQRTAWLWGLAPPAARTMAARPPGGDVTADDPGAAHWLCRVGCAGHAHAWLQADGHCRRDGEPCAALQRPTE